MEPLRKLLIQAEKALEAILFASRWLLAPVYLGLAISLVVLTFKFLVELSHLVLHAVTSTETQVILGVLALVDLSLTASLIVIVIFSGYENFVSKIDHSGHEDWPEWMGTIDFTALKLKLLSSIVAISAIQLLKSFMEIRTLNDREIMWAIIIHVVFVISSVLLALSDRIAGHGNDHGAPPAKGPDHGGDGGGDGHKEKPAKPEAKVEPHTAAAAPAAVVRQPTILAPATAADAKKLH